MGRTRGGHLGTAHVAETHRQHRQEPPVPGHWQPDRIRHRREGLRLPRHREGHPVLHPQLPHQGGRERRYTIGQFPAWKVAAARAKAAELKKRVDNGEDPMGEFEATTCRAHRWPTSVSASRRNTFPGSGPGLRVDYKSFLDRHILPALKNHKVADVTFSDIDALHRKITKDAPYVANRVISVLSKMFALAIKLGLPHRQPDAGHRAQPGSQTPPLPVGRRARPPVDRACRTPRPAVRQHHPTPPPHRRAAWRSPRHAVGPARPRGRCVDEARHADEAEARASGSAIGAGQAAPRRASRSGSGGGRVRLPRPGGDRTPRPLAPGLGGPLPGRRHRRRPAARPPSHLCVGARLAGLSLPVIGALLGHQPAPDDGTIRAPVRRSAAGGNRARRRHRHAASRPPRSSRSGGVMAAVDSLRTPTGEVR